MMLIALNTIAADQTKPTKRTLVRCKQFLDYAALQEEAVVICHTSKMVLTEHRDALYLSENEAPSHAGGQWCMSRDAEPPDNGAIHNLSHVL